MIIITDRNILSPHLDNLQFLTNCFNWLTSFTGQKGDLNQDGVIDILDIVIVVNITLGVVVPNEYQQWASDFNEDGQINILDIVQMVNIIIGAPQLPDECYLEPDIGPCDGSCPRYFFNQEIQECQVFFWGCCDGIVPFETLEECQSACE